VLVNVLEPCLVRVRVFVGVPVVLVVVGVLDVRESRERVQVARVRRAVRRASR